MIVKSKDVITPKGYAEIIEDYGKTVLVEYPNRKREIWSKNKLQKVM